MRTMKRLHQLIVTVALTVIVTTQLGHAETYNSNFLQIDWQEIVKLKKISEDERLARTLNKDDIWPMPENYLDFHAFKKNDLKDLDCLSHNIYYEAGHEPTEGKIAVGLVTLNRVADQEFPKKICDVVRQRVNGTCQFSWTCMKLKTPDYKSTAWRESKRIAKKLLENHDDLDVYKIKYANVMYFHHKSVQPGWNKKMIRLSTGGENIFYRGRL